LQVTAAEEERGGFLGRDPADDDDSGAAGMGIAAPPSQTTTTTYVSQPTKTTAAATSAGRLGTANSMSHSQDFHQGSGGVFGFSSDGGYDRPDSSQDQQQQQDQQQHVAQQSRREKLRVQQQGFEHGQLLPIEQGDDAEPGAAAMYDHQAAAAGATNMLSEMFSYPALPPSGPSATNLLASQMTANYRFGMRPGGLSGDSSSWFEAAGGRAGGLVLGGGAGMGPSLCETSSPKQQGGMAGGIATDPAAAMQLFLMNPQQQSRSSPPPSDAQSAIQQQHDAQSAIQQQHDAFQAFAAAPFGGGAVEGQGLSLSLSPSLQQLEMAKQAEELRVRDGVLYFNNRPQQQLLPMALHPGQVGAQLEQQQLNAVGVGGYGPAGVLRNSKYTRAAQELLEEFCSVGRGGLVKGTRGGRGASSSNPNNKGGAASSSGAAQSPSASKEPPQLCPADRLEHQRKKARLISMLDEARPQTTTVEFPSLPFSLVHARVDEWCRMCC
jgi:hypothetical protein